MVGLSRISNRNFHPRISFCKQTQDSIDKYWRIKVIILIKIIQHSSPDLTINVVKSLACCPNLKEIRWEYLWQLLRGGKRRPAAILNGFLQLHMVVLRQP